VKWGCAAPNSVLSQMQFTRVSCRSGRSADPATEIDQWLTVVAQVDFAKERK